jgi:hypothetical protein
MNRTVSWRSHLEIGSVASRPVRFMSGFVSMLVLVTMLSGSSVFEMSRFRRAI